MYLYKIWKIQFFLNSLEIYLRNFLQILKFAEKYPAFFYSGLFNQSENCSFYTFWDFIVFTSRCCTNFLTTYVLWT